MKFKLSCSLQIHTFSIDFVLWSVRPSQWNCPVVVSLPNLLYFVLLSKNYIISTVCSLLQGPYSPWEERITFHVFFTRVCYIFQNLQETSSILEWVSRGFYPNLMWPKNNLYYILHWYYLIFCGFLERGIFPSRDF